MTLRTSVPEQAVPGRESEEKRRGAELLSAWDKNGLLNINSGGMEIGS